MDKENISSVYFNFLCDFSTKENCIEAKQNRKECFLEEIIEEPLISFCMCTYNDVRLLNSAINSLLNQKFKNWELIILDNSDKSNEAWEMIQNAEWLDKRIRGFKSKKNVGWAKGISELLPYAKGKYMTFLAADDCININTLDDLSKLMEADYPDVLYVGNFYTFYENEYSVKVLDSKVSSFTAKYGTEKRSEAIVEIMQNVYYNSAFHYLKIEFMRKHGIDFYEPYWGDCVSMTKALSVADKISVWNKPVYCLTRNTSQNGPYTWQSYKFLFAKQWEMIRGVFINEHFTDVQAIQYAAVRILRNCLAMLGRLCSGICRDRQMNPIKKDNVEVIHQLEEALVNREIVEMLYYAGMDGFNGLLENIKNYIDVFGDYSEKSWLSPIFTLVAQEECLSDKEKFEYITVFLLDQENICCVGECMFFKLLEALNDTISFELKDKIEIVLKKIETYHTKNFLLISK